MFLFVILQSLPAEIETLFHKYTLLGISLMRGHLLDIALNHHKSVVWGSSPDCDARIGPMLATVFSVLGKA